LTDLQRLTCDVVSDNHIHPGYSIDAEGSVDDYCRAAIAVGLKEICFTTHYDADPARLDHEGFMVINGKREKLSDNCIRTYLEDVKRAADEFGQAGLMVRGGMEFGYFPNCEKQIADLQSKFRFDYRLGSVHNIGSECVCYREETVKLFSRMTLNQLADRYFELLDQCAASGLFDCLGHLDVYRRYGFEYYGEGINTAHRGRIEKLFETMKKHNVGYEVNTSAIRHGFFEYYPGMEIINMARAAGVPLRALGSDAHRPGQIALDFDAASAVAYELVPYVDE
jgi:histidinol-phosphatase (PHP family)